MTNQHTSLSVGRSGRIADLEQALSLALDILIQHEPADSRAVSDEFVSMTAVLCDLSDLSSAREIIAKASANHQDKPAQATNNTISEEDTPTPHKERSE